MALKAWRHSDERNHGLRTRVTDLNQNFGPEEALLKVVPVDLVVFVQEERPRVFRHNIV
jgi:hypothetical protein